MKTMCPFGYHHNVFVVTHALGHIWKTFSGLRHFLSIDWVV